MTAICLVPPSEAAASIWSRYWPLTVQAQRCYAISINRPPASATISTISTSVLQSTPSTLTAGLRAQLLVSV
jgi:hypothetical protein